MSAWKCTKCRAMVPENLLKQHKCSAVANLKTGNRGTDGKIELAYLRGKQSELLKKIQKKKRKRAKK